MKYAKKFKFNRVKKPFPSQRERSEGKIYLRDRVPSDINEPKPYDGERIIPDLFARIEGQEAYQTELYEFKKTQDLTAYSVKVTTTEPLDHYYVITDSLIAHVWNSGKGAYSLANCEQWYRQTLVEYDLPAEFDQKESGCTAFLLYQYPDHKLWITKLAGIPTYGKTIASQKFFPECELIYQDLVHERERYQYRPVPLSQVTTETDDPLTPTGFTHKSGYRSITMEGMFFYVPYNCQYNEINNSVKDKCKVERDRYVVLDVRLNYGDSVSNPVQQIVDLPTDVTLSVLNAQKSTPKIVFPLSGMIEYSAEAEQPLPLYSAQYDQIIPLVKSALIQQSVLLPRVYAYDIDLTLLDLEYLHGRVTFAEFMRRAVKMREKSKLVPTGNVDDSGLVSNIEAPGVHQSDIEEFGSVLGEIFGSLRRKRK